MFGSRRTFGFFPNARREEVIDRVPDSDVDRVMRDFKDSGASKVMVEPEANETWRITAVFE
jgi:hypothetical protein